MSNNKEKKKKTENNPEKNIKENIEKWGQTYFYLTQFKRKLYISSKFDVRYPSFIIINKYINTSVAIVAIKGEFQAYMKRARTAGRGKGYKGRDRGPIAEARWKR